MTLLLCYHVQRLFVVCQGYYTEENVSRLFGVLQYCSFSIPRFTSGCLLCLCYTREVFLSSYCRFFPDDVRR